MAVSNTFWANLFLDWSNSLTTLPQEEMKTFLNAVKAENITNALAVVKKSKALLENTKLCVAITGEWGSGKSSFINAIRGLADDDVDAAEVGVKESTKKPTSYLHPKYPNVILWDLPGTGILECEATAHVEEVDFARFDFFIIITAGRFREVHVNLAQQIQKMWKKFYFVRSKVDVDLDSERKGKLKFKEEEVLCKIRNDCIRNLKEKGIISPQVFLVSRWHWENYDFPQLQETFLNDLNTLKIHTIFQGLFSICERHLNWKKVVLEQQILKEALKSCLIAIIPLPFLSVWWDVDILMRSMTKFCKSFGLDDYSLRLLENSVGRPVELKTVIQCPLTKDRPRNGAFMLLKKATGQGMMIAKCFISMIPVVGTVIAVVTSYKITGRLLHMLVTEVAKDAQRVLKRALEEAEKTDY